MTDPNTGPAKESNQEHSHTSEFHWEPTEIFASKEILKKYINLLALAGISLDAKTVKAWLSDVPRDKGIIEIKTESFEEAIKSATYDEKKAAEFDKKPPELSFKMKTFLADARKIRHKPKQARVTHAHLINSLDLEGATIAARLKNLNEKHKNVLDAIDSEGMACLVLGKILGYDWEINVNNAELIGILRDVRSELKFSTVPRELLAQYDQILMKSGIAMSVLIKDFGLNPKEMK